MDQGLGDPVDMAGVERTPRQRSEHLRLLAAALHELHREHDLDAILQRLVELAVRLTAAHGGTAGLVEDGRLVFRRHLLAGVWQDVDDPLPVDHGAPSDLPRTLRTSIGSSAAPDGGVVPEIRETLPSYSLIDCPVLTADSELLGRVRLHSPRDGRTFDAYDQALLETLAAAASLAIQQVRGRATHDAAQEKLRQYAKLFEATSEGIVITDRQRRIVDVNPAFCQVTGYRRDEVLGSNPNMLQSGRHDSAFYQAMWESIRTTGRWRGEIWNRRKSGEIYPEWLSINAVHDDKGEIAHFVGVFTDISTIKESQERLQRLAHHDPLTDLPNKLLFGARLAHALHRGHRDQTRVAVLFLDLDRFKNVNDTLGHPAGDRLLRKVAARLRACVREDDTVARLGGDEFTVVLEGVHDSRDIVPIAQKIIDKLKQPITIGGQDLFVTVSIGISVYPEDGTDNATLLKNADSAMYRAKDQGRNNYQFYTKELTREAFERLALETSLRRALEREEFELHYQPQYCLRRGALVGAEALVRWRHPELGMVSPARFIPVAEDIGLIEPLGRWILDAACRQAVAWEAAGHAPIVVAVNLSAAQVMRGGVAHSVRECLRASGLPGWRLELELTESVFMDRQAQVVETLDALKALGVSLAIDDFGTGYSSLGYLKRLPIDKLKIDQSFVRDIPGDENDAAIARAIMALGRSMQMVVVAEGVESREQEAFFRSEDCDQIQGYRFGHPVPAAEFERVLRNPHEFSDRI